MEPIDLFITKHEKENEKEYVRARGGKKRKRVSESEREREKIQANDSMSFAKIIVLFFLQICKKRQRALTHK